MAYPGIEELMKMDLYAMMGVKPTATMTEVNNANFKTNIYYYFLIETQRFFELM